MWVCVVPVYHSEMNSFEYCASLHVLHPTLDPEQITAALGISPTKQTRVGSPRQNPKGEELGGKYAFSSWRCGLPTTNGERLSEFLWSVVKLLSPHRKFLMELAASGGEIECFVGLFTERNCDELFPCDLLSAFGNMKIGLRLDIYGKELPQTWGQ